MVRGLASDLPAGVDLSKAKAWIKIDGTGTIGIDISFNINSITDQGTGQYYVVFGVPFKTADYIIAGSCQDSNAATVSIGAVFSYKAGINTHDHQGSAQDTDPIYVVFFGELENE